ncbi:MAG TPA: helix-hairpin-helix domain-containing protein [Nostocaceae cyanobacterium]|nr:helix-hairpin-helix domain-containing protein [Nostocaceae cyanobacterium]
MVNAKQEAITVLNEAINELESLKGSVTSGVQKLLNAAQILDEESIKIWCEVHLGKPDYILPLQDFSDVLYKCISKNEDNPEKEEKLKKIVKETKQVIEGYGIKIDSDIEIEDIIHLCIIQNEGGYKLFTISFLEEKYKELLKNKQEDDDIYNKSDLLERIGHVKRKANEKAVNLLKAYVYTNTAKTAFDFLKEEVDDKLLDLNPELAEKLMAAFKSVSSKNSEEWSQALTSCRRLIEKLADELYPPTDEQINGRKLGKEQYINRLWIFMDKAIESDSNRDLAKTHVDFLGSYLQKTHKLTNKGVHTSITKMEAVKTVFHTYLLIADLLGYLDKRFLNKETKININTATIDEIESILGVNRKIAKEIIKSRVEHGTLTSDLLGTIQGIGQKTVAKAVELFSFDLVE